MILPKAWIFRILIIAGMIQLAFSARSLVYAENKPGFILLAPDRGFMGNNEIREVFHEFQTRIAPYPAHLVFAGKTRMEDYLTEAVDSLKAQNVTKIVVIPLFFSETHWAWRRARALLEPSATVDRGDHEASVQSPESMAIEFAPTLSNSYLTEQILEDLAREMSEDPEREELVILGADAETLEDARAIEETIRRLSVPTQKRLGFREVHVFVLLERKAENSREHNQKIYATIKTLSEQGNKSILVIPFFISYKLTPMMSLENRIRRGGLRGISVRYTGRSILPHPNVVRWAVKTANSHIPITREEVGIVFMNHGSYYEYNEKMRRTVRPLAEAYKLEFAMSMADPLLIQQAVDRLEARGARHIILLRVVSMKRSFRDKSRYILGLDDTYLHQTTRPPDRVRSAAVFHTAGGVEDDSLFAAVLLERALSISREPSKEVVILVAHGLGDDEGDAYWRTVLQSLARQMQAMAEEKFSDIWVATWREDWPEKRKQAVKEVRAMIHEIRSSGRRPLLVAARIEGNDPGAEYLKDLNVAFNDEGFSGHANLVRWCIKTIESVLSDLQPRNMVQK